MFKNLLVMELLIQGINFATEINETMNAICINSLYN